MKSCRKCMIRYGPRLDLCRFFNVETDQRSSAFLSLMGIPGGTLFSGSLDALQLPPQNPKGANARRIGMSAPFCRYPSHGTGKPAG